MCKRAYVLLCSLQQCDMRGGQFDEALNRLQRSEFWQAYYEGYESQRQSLEITLQGEYTYRYQFVVPELCLYLKRFSNMRERMKDMLDAIPRDNVTAKQSEFMWCVKSWYFEAAHVHMLLRLSNR